MTTGKLLTISEMADRWNEPPQRISYMVSKNRIKPTERVGIIRLFTEEQAKVIKGYVYHMQIRN